MYPETEKNHCRKSITVLIAAVVRPSSGGVAMRYVLPVTCITSCLPVIGQANETRRGRILKVTHQGAAESIRNITITLKAISPFRNGWCVEKNSVAGMHSV